MPRYFFHIKDGVTRFDREGLDLPHFDAARIEAVRKAGTILQDEALKIAFGDDWAVEVTDKVGLILFVVTLLVVEAPAVLRDA